MASIYSGLTSQQPPTIEALFSINLKVSLTNLAILKSSLFSRTETSFSSFSKLTDLKPLGIHPNGLLFFFIILIDWWIASGGEQLTKKALMFVFLKALSASSKLSPDLSNVPSSSCTQKLNQTFFSVFKV